MKNIFRKGRASSLNHDPGSVTCNDAVIMSTKEVKSKDSGDVTTYVECKTVNAKDYSKTLNLPTDDEYQLQDMIKAGQIPEEVPVSGMLNSQDPTDLSNQGVGDAIFDKLASQVKEPASKPAAEPAPVVEPSNAE